MRPIGIVLVSTLGMITFPVEAVSSTIRNARLRLTGSDLEVILETQNRQAPKISTNQRGNSWTVELSDVRLDLPNGNSFFRADPAPGISAVTILPLDQRTIQIIFSSTQGGIRGEVSQSPAGIVLKFPISKVQSSGTSDAPRGRLVPPLPAKIDSTETTLPFIPGRAIAPPTGDIAVSSIGVPNSNITFGSNERIPTLVLKDAPAEDVLSVLAMTVGLNTVFVDTKEDKAPTTGTAQVSASIGNKPTVSMEIKNETVENVFNYVLQVSDLQASRVGNTILIGRDLPNAARGVIVKSLRLNQIKASLPETQITTTANTASSISSGGGSVGTGGQSNVTTSQLSRTSTISRRIPLRGAQQLLEALGANGGGASTPPATRPTATVGGQNRIRSQMPLLDGLQVSADSRTNSVILIGTPSLVDVAISYLKQVDVRSRQVTVNVKIIEVSLDDQESLGSSFSFGVDDSFFNLNQGQVNANFGRTNPTFVPPIPSNTPDGSQGPSSLLSPPVIDNPPLSNPFQFPNKFLLNLQARIRSNKGKILTDPTLIVQEGSASQVNLTSQVFAGLRTISETGPGNQPRTISDPREPIDVGVILNIAVDQIDDNGFISLSVSPEVSSPGERIVESNGTLIQQLVQRRRLDTGSIRLKDGQTLYLAGIIQENDRDNVSKVPLLGDIPLIGNLFRSRTVDRERSEVIVLITPTITD